MYYAPWCGHCKNLKPIWDQLGEAFIGTEDLIIAKLDATANEVVGPKITGFPTIFFYPKDNKEGISYDGGREFTDFQKWLEEERLDETPVAEEEVPVAEKEAEAEEQHQEDL